MRFIQRGLVLALLVLVAVAAFSPVLGNPAAAQADAGMKRALATFAIARGLNAVISLAQGTEVTAGFGAELTLSVGQVLDPINDLVESFSNLMLMATVAFGIQKILLAIGQYMYVKWAVVALLAVWGALYALGRQRPSWLNQVVLLALMLRFAIAAVTVGSDAIYTHFLQQEYQRSNAQLDTAAKAVDQTITELRTQTDAAAVARAQPPVAEPAPQQDKTWMEQAGEMFDELTKPVTQMFRKFDPRPYLATLREQASQATQHIIDLIVVFLLQTVLVPLVLLWAMYTAMRSAIVEHRAR
jgi:hypothetical protein